MRGLLPRDEFWSVNQIISKEINEFLEYKRFCNNFLFLELWSGWTQENQNLDYLLFDKDSFHLLEKGNTKLAKSLLALMINSDYGNTVINSVYIEADFRFNMVVFSIKARTIC